MKRPFLVFAAEPYETKGGMRDCQGRFATKEEAENFVVDRGRENKHSSPRFRVGNVISNWYSIVDIREED